MTQDPHGGLYAARLLGDTFSNFTDLLKKETELAKAEIADKLAAKASAAIWMAVGAFVALIGLIVVVEAIVFAIASTGILLHWACLIVAGGLFVISAGFFLYGRSNAREDMTPTRSVRQLRRDLATAREQMVRE
jgi:hypothetical protein